MGNRFSENFRTLGSNKNRFNVSINLEIVIEHEPQEQCIHFLVATFGGTTEKLLADSLMEDNEF